MLSDQTVSISELQNDINLLKAQVQDLNSQLELILKTFVKHEHVQQTFGNTEGELVNHKRDQETAVLIIERLEEVERILT